MGKVGTHRATVAERSLLYGSLGALAALALGLAAATPANASAGMSEAESLRKLDIMLMVTSLRCRATADNFQADYSQFVNRHRQTLSQANYELKAELASRYGARGATNALDKMSVTMANGYGRGHPWLSCGELKQVTRNLVDVRGRATLAEAASQVLAPGRVTHFAYAER